MHFIVEWHGRDFEILNNFESIRFSRMIEDSADRWVRRIQTILFVSMTHSLSFDAFGDAVNVAEVHSWSGGFWMKIFKGIRLRQSWGIAFFGIRDNSDKFVKIATNSDEFGKKSEKFGEI